MTLRKSPITALRKENLEKVLSVVISPNNTIVFFEITKELDNMKEIKGGAAPSPLGPPAPDRRRLGSWGWCPDLSGRGGSNMAVPTRRRGHIGPSLSLSILTCSGHQHNTEDLRSSSEEHHCSISYSESYHPVRLAYKPYFFSQRTIFFSHNKSKQYFQPCLISQTNRQVS